MIEICAAGEKEKTYWAAFCDVGDGVFCVWISSDFAFFRDDCCCCCDGVVVVVDDGRGRVDVDADHCCYWRDVTCFFDDDACRDDDDDDDDVYAYASGV